MVDKIAIWVLVVAISIGFGYFWCYQATHANLTQWIEDTYQLDMYADNSSE